MPGIRWLFIFFAVWLVFMILRQMRENRRKTSTRNTSHPVSEYTAMVACQHCQVHIPEIEAIQRDGRYFCCKECCTQYADSSVMPMNDS